MKIIQNSWHYESQISKQKKMDIILNIILFIICCIVVGATLSGILSIIDGIPFPPETKRKK